MTTEGPEQLIRGWARERPDLDFAPMATMAMSMTIYETVHRRMAHLLQPIGLGTSEAATIAVLRSSGEPYRLTPTMLSRMVVCTTGAMTRVLDGLQGRDLIRRIPSPTDRRSLLIELTEQGVELSEHILELQARVTGEALGALAPAEREQLEGLLAKLAQGAGVSV